MKKNSIFSDEQYGARQATAKLFWLLIGLNVNSCRILVDEPYVLSRTGQYVSRVFKEIYGR